MTVAELIAKLQECDPARRVCFVDRRWGGEKSATTLLPIEDVQPGVMHNGKDPDGDYSWISGPAPKGDSWGTEAVIVLE